jgi:hypothetical protein
MSEINCPQYIINKKIKMINPTTEYIYNIVLSIFVGFIIANTINILYQKPITQIIYKK